MIFRTFAVLTALFVSTLAAEAACDFSNPTPYGALDSMAKAPGTEKGEYETTAAWAARLKDKFGGAGNITAVAPPDDDLVKYDADKGQLTLATSIFLKPVMARDGTQLEVLTVGSRRWPDGEFVAQNALGVSKVVTRSHFDSMWVGWSKEGYSYLRDLHDITLRLTPAQAEDLRGHIAFAVAGPAVPPFTVSLAHVSTPTIDDPTQRFAFERGVVIRPVCAALIDTRSKKVLALYDLPKGRQLSR